MQTPWQDSLDYIADLRQRGVGDTQIGQQLRRAGWNREQVQALLRGDPSPAAAPAPVVLSPAPPPPAQPHRALLDRALPWTVAFVLLAIIGSGFALTRRAKTAEPICLTHAKDLVVAMGLYASDSDGYFPAGVAWPTAVTRYLPHSDDLLCPADERSEKQADGGVRTSYTMNQLCSSARTNLASPFMVQLFFDGHDLFGDATAADFRHDAPAQSQAAGPGMIPPGGGFMGQPIPMGPGLMGPPGAHAPAGRPGAGLNVAFADGHVAWQPQAQFAMTPLQYPTRGGIVEALAPNMPSTGPPPAEGSDLTDPSEDPLRRYELVRHEPPSSSSDKIHASVRIDAPDSVYAEEHFTATAHGSYTLSDDLRSLIRSGPAQIKEGYMWDGYPVVIVGEPQPREQQVTAYYTPKDEFDTSKPEATEGLWVAYVVAVRMPDGTFQWARAENHLMPKVWRFGIIPISPGKGKRGAAVGDAFGTCQIHQPVHFEAQGFLDPGDVITSGISWEWEFDDGATATGNPVSHSFNQCGFYTVYLRGVYQGRVAESFVTVVINSNNEDDRMEGRQHKPHFPRDRYDAIQMRYGYAPPNK
jgi:prepilin-type processing-associated H-X9-DG protein